MGRGLVGIRVKPHPKARIGKRAEPEDLLVRSPVLVLVSLSLREGVDWGLGQDVVAGWN